MWIPRTLAETWSAPTLPVRILRGMRQVGKSSLLEHLGPGRRHVSLDDLLVRRLAETDPALFFARYPPPVTIDEAQHAPGLFDVLKVLVDDARRRRRDGGGDERPDIAWLTGSNQVLLDGAVRESLAGRASHATLHTLSVHELTSAGIVAPARVSDMLLRGGWPELYADASLDLGAYLDDLLVTWVEKDIVLAAGIEKRGAFTQVLRHVAARTGQRLNASEIAAATGVQVPTVLGWVDVLERMLVVRRLPVWSSNLNKRLTRTPKLYVLDVGLASRLQGWTALDPLLVSPSAGPLFETLVFGEIVRAIDHAKLSAQVHTWRTRDGEEVDFVVTSGSKALVLDAKLAIQGVSAATIPRGVAAAFPSADRLVLVTIGGTRTWLSRGCEVVPIAELQALLVETFGAGGS